MTLCVSFLSLQLRSAGLSLVSAFVSSPLGSVMFVSMGAHRWLFPLLCLPTPECKAALLPILTALLSCEGEMGDGSERENFSHFLLEAGLGRALLPWLATPEHAREGKALMKIALGRVVTDTTETVFLRGALEAVSAAETVCFIV